MSYNLEFTIYNYPLTNVSATDGITTITLGNGISVDTSGNSYRGIIVSENDSASITVLADGFVPQTKTIYDDVIDSFTLTRINNLYAYTDPNVIGETLYAWDVSSVNSSATPSTIYTKTETIDASTEYFNADGSQLDITTITFNSYTATGFKWFSSGSTPTIAFDCSSISPTIPTTK